MPALILSFMKGKSHLELTNESFRRVLRLASTYQLDPNLFPPTVVAHFEEIRRELAASPLAKLWVSSVPEGA